jgi:hypothetical protein
MRCIYNYISESNHVSRVCSFAATLHLKFMLHVMSFPMSSVLYLHTSTLQSVCAVPNIAVFSSFLASCFHGVVVRYFLNYFEIVLVARITAAIASACIFRMSCISTVRFFMLALSQLLS